MPLLSQPIMELPTHVYLPVIQQTAHTILHELALNELIGDQIYIKTDFTTYAGTSTLDHNAKVNQQAFRIEANIQMNPTSQKWDMYSFHHTAAYGVSNWTLAEHSPIYDDKENGIHIVEMRSPVTITLNCELTVISKELAYATPHQIFNMYENGVTHDLRDLFYDYPLPKSIVDVLYGLWQMDRRKGQPAGVSFVEYLQNNTEGQWQHHINKDIPNEVEIVIPSPDIQCLGVLEYSDDKPQADQENRIAKGFTLPFVYTIQFASPTLNLMQFPCLYNNQPVPLRYIPRHKTVRRNRLEGTRVSYAHQNFMLEINHEYAQAHQIPDYDDWSYPNNAQSRNANQQPFLITILGVDEDNEGNAVDTVIDLLEDNPDYKLTNLTKEILYQEGEEATERDCIYSVQLFRNAKQLNGALGDYSFDEDLKVRFKPMNLHDTYRLVLTYPANLYYINPKWWGLLLRYYKYFPGDWRRQIEEWAREHGIDLNNLNDPNAMSEWWHKYGGDGNASLFQSRIAKYSIIARSTKES